MGLTHEKTFVTLKDLNIGININRPMAWCDETHWQMIYHYHRELEIIYVDKGSLICGINSDSFKVSEGDIVFFPSMTPHYTYTNESGSTRSYIQFRRAIFSRPARPRAVWTSLCAAGQSRIMFSRPGQRRIRSFWTVSKAFSMSLR